MDELQQVSAPSPADSAFLGGTLCLPAEASQEYPADGFPAGNPAETATDALILASTLLIMLFIRKIAGILPSLIRCALRWKESLTLEYSMKASRDRNTAAMVLFLPFCLIVWMYDLLPFRFAASLPPWGGFAATAGILLGYMLVRRAAGVVVNRRKIDGLSCDAAAGLFPTFLCLASVTMIPVAAVLAFAGAPQALSRDIMLYTAGAFYLVMLLRKYQIFNHSCKNFTTILYLCALEIFPTGLLVSAALIF